MDKQSDAQHEYLLLSRHIQALCRQLKSRKKSDVANRTNVAAQLAEARAKRDALVCKEG